MTLNWLDGERGSILSALKHNRENLYVTAGSVTAGSDEELIRVFAPGLIGMAEMDGGTLRLDAGSPERALLAFSIVHSIVQIVASPNCRRA